MLSKKFRAVRIAHLACFFVIPAVLLVMRCMEGSGFTPVCEGDDLMIHFMEISLAIVAVFNLAIALSLPLLMKRVNEKKTGELTLLVVHFIQMIICCSIAVYGLMLYFIGSDEYVSLLYFFAALLALLFTFPTRKNWKNLVKNDEANAMR